MNNPHIDENGNKLWRNDKGQIHRLDGPAIEWVSGTKSWRLNGKRHRLDGPAIEYYDDSKIWFLNNKIHRLNGPAYQWNNGLKEWLIYNQNVSSINDFFSKLAVR